MNNYRLCFFDMEGTLLAKNKSLDNGKVAPSAWTVLAKTISNECYMDEELSKDRWLAGEYISYTAWMMDTVRIQIRHGMRKDHLQVIIDAAELHDGAYSLVSYLKQNRIATALISGGFKELADMTQVELGIDHAYSACQYFFREDGSVAHYNLLPTDEEGKLVFMEHLAKEYGVTLKDCIFIGDGKNDVRLAQACGLSIAFNAQQELIDVSTHAVVQSSENLEELIGLLKSHL
jgi:phosphoserine phosphatase